MADKQRSGVLEAATNQFLDSTPMQRLLETSDFDLGELKDQRQGLTIYLTLPQRFMETHYRWLRLMITLAVGEMERIKGRPGNRASDPLRARRIRRLEADGGNRERCGAGRRHGD